MFVYKCSEETRFTGDPECSPENEIDDFETFSRDENFMYFSFA